MNRIHILYLTYDGISDQLGQSQILPYLTRLSHLGFNISLISFEKDDKLSKYREEIEKITFRYNISWYPLRYTRNPPVISTLINLFFLYRITLKIHRKNPVALIHCRSYLTSLIGLRMKKKLTLPFIFDMRGFWADERIDAKIWSLRNPIHRLIYNYFKQKEKQLLTAADHVVVLTKQARFVIQSSLVFSELPIPISVIPCCVDLKHFNPSSSSVAAKNNLRERLNISKSTFVMSYVGSIGTWYMLSEMLAFFNRWLIKYPESVLLFITNDSFDNIFDVSTKQGVSKDKIRVAGASRNEMPLFLSISDCSVFFITPLFSKKASSPTKQAEIMSMGVPVICNSGIGDTDTIILNWKSGLLVDKFTNEKYDEIIDRFRHTNFDSNFIRQGAEVIFSLEEGVSSYKMIYNLILKK